MAGRRGNGEGAVYQRASDGRWLGAVVVGYDPEGRPRRTTVSARTRSEAVAKLKQLQRQIDDGLPAPDPALTVAKLLARWHEDVLRHQVSASTAANYRAIADHHVLPTLGRKRVLALSPADVDGLLSDKLDEGLSVSTVRRIRNVLSQALDQGQRWGVVHRNVASLTRGPKARRQEGRTLTPEEARRLLSALAGHRNEALYALMLATVACAGARRSGSSGATSTWTPAASWWPASSPESAGRS